MRLDRALLAGRKLSADDLQLLILSLLSLGPKHGYEIMAQIEARSLGYYRPSPGTVYPALTNIKISGEATVETQSVRKRYRITDAGRVRLQQGEVALQDLWAQLEQRGRMLAGAWPTLSDAVAQARAALDDALRSTAATAPESQQRIAQLLRDTAASIRA